MAAKSKEKVRVNYGDGKINFCLHVMNELTHSGQRTQNIYWQEEINLYWVIKLAIEISLFSLQINKMWCFVEKNKNMNIWQSFQI